MTKHIQRILSTSLSVIALHSFAVGIGLIAHRPWMIELSGFQPIKEPFFPTQGGVFHIVMAVGYAMAAYNLKAFHSLAFFAIIVKSMAAIFLFTYFFAVKANSMILISGLADGFFAIALSIEYRFYLKKIRAA